MRTTACFLLLTAALLACGGAKGATERTMIDWAAALQTELMERLAREMMSLNDISPRPTAFA